MMQQVTNKNHNKQHLIDILLGAFGFERTSKRVGITNLKGIGKFSRATKGEIKGKQKNHQEALFETQVRKVRAKYSGDPLVPNTIIHHEVTHSIGDEIDLAQFNKTRLTQSASQLFVDNVAQAQSMNVVTTEAKESVSEVVESMLRNPEAMQLVDDLRAYDNLSYKHAVDVCVLMVAFGRELKLPKNVLVELGIGGLLHDIGEAKPPSGKQIKVKNIAMYNIYKTHVDDGIALMESTHYSDIVKAIVAEHHERYDGSGYPNQLCNILPKSYGGNYIRKNVKRISMYGLMIGIVDTYVSMVSARTNNKPIAPSESVSYILSRAGSDFDPSLCEVFSQVIGVYPVGCYVELNTGEIAVVIKQNRVWRLKPHVQVVMNEAQKPTTPFIVNLAHPSCGRSIKKEVKLNQ